MCVAGFAALCGSVSLIYPFGRDQGSYGYAGWVMLEGGVPYRDVFVFKPPMTVVVHGAAMGLFGVNTWAIRAFDLGWNAVTALVVAAIALELWGRRDAALAAGLLYPFLYYQIDYWNIAQTDGWMVLPCAAAVWASLRGGRAMRRSARKAAAWWFGAGALAGVAVLFKYTAAAIGLPMLVVLAWVSAVQGRRVWLGAGAMIFGGLATLSACWIWLRSTGAWIDFLDIQLGLIPSYVERRTNAETTMQTLEQLIGLKGWRSDVLPLFCAGPAGLLAMLPTIHRSERSTWAGLGVALAWWLAAASNIVVQGKFFDYHYLTLTAPSALVAGLGLAKLLRRPLSRLRRELRAAAVVALIGILIAVTPFGGRVRDLARVMLGPQTMEDYLRSRREYGFPSYDVDEIRRVSKLLAETTSTEQRVFVWGYDATINVRSRRHTVSRFLYNYPFRAIWANPEYETELMEALRARPPDVVVVASGDRFLGISGTYQDSAGLLREFSDLRMFVTQRYERSEKIGRYVLWRLRAAPVERSGAQPVNP